MYSEGGETDTGEKKREDETSGGSPEGCSFQKAKKVMERSLCDVGMTKNCMLSASNFALARRDVVSISIERLSSDFYRSRKLAMFAAAQQNAHNAKIHVAHS
jgi:hypothetical protein